MNDICAPERRGPLEFLVAIKVNWPPSNDSDQKAELIRQEGERAKVLIAEGKIMRIWRIPGKWANVGIWCAHDATELHELVTSLPMNPWIDVSVIPLANHPSDPGPG